MCEETKTGSNMTLAADIGARNGPATDGPAANGTAANGTAANGTARDDVGPDAAANNGSEANGNEANDDDATERPAKPLRRLICPVHGPADPTPENFLTGRLSESKVQYSCRQDNGRGLPCNEVAYWELHPDELRNFSERQYEIVENRERAKEFDEKEATRHRRIDLLARAVRRVFHVEPPAGSIAWEPSAPRDSRDIYDDGYDDEREEPVIHLDGHRFIAALNGNLSLVYQCVCGQRFNFAFGNLVEYARVRHNVPEQEGLPYQHCLCMSVDKPSPPAPAGADPIPHEEDALRALMAEAEEAAHNLEGNGTLALALSNIALARTMLLAQGAQTRAILDAYDR